DPNVPIDKLSALPALISESLRRQRFYTTLLAIFAVTAMLMAMTGIYAVTSYVVARRTRELGVRAALGAKWTDIMTLVLGRELLLTLCGIAFGIAGSFATTRLLRGLLFEIQPTDRGVLIGVALLLALIALCASYLPARRAARIDP